MADVLCPVCGARATIVIGRYISMIDGSVLTPEQLGKPGPGYAFTVEDDYLDWPPPCPGYMVMVGEGFRHLTEAEARPRTALRLLRGGP